MNGSKVFEQSFLRFFYFFKKTWTPFKINQICVSNKIFLTNFLLTKCSIPQNCRCFNKFFKIILTKWFFKDYEIIVDLTFQGSQSNYLHILCCLSFHYSLRQQFNDNRKRNERWFSHQITFVMSFIREDNPKLLAGIYLFFLYTSLPENLIFKLNEFVRCRVVKFWSELKISVKNFFIKKLKKFDEWIKKG
jgi:hypothetical protein